MVILCDLSIIICIVWVGNIIKPLFEHTVNSLSFFGYKSMRMF